MMSAIRCYRYREYALIAGFGTKLPIRDVRNPVATGGITDMARTAHFGRD